MMGWKKTSELQAYMNKNHMADLPIMPKVAVASLAKVHTTKVATHKRKRKRKSRLRSKHVRFKL